MKEAVISAATLAGLVGLACLYGNGGVSHRMKRDADLAELAEYEAPLNNTEVDGTYDLLEAMGWFEADADVPVEFVEDVKMYQERAGGNKKSIQFVSKCLNNPRCKTNAIATVQKWGNNNKQYMESNWEVLMHPIATGSQEDEGNENDFGVCTPNDDVFPCADASLNVAPVANTAAHTQVSAMIGADIAAAATSSSALNLAVNTLNVQSVNDADNVFQSPNLKLFVIVPNGIPVSMADTYKGNWGNYWGFFKDFNDKYIGISKQSTARGRGNMHFWFMRQDKNAKMLMKAPAKASKRFPWSRFDKLMAAPQNSANQPKIKNTYSSMMNEVNNKNFASAGSEGRDCVIMWFHQYIPADILSLSDSEGQETIASLETACNIIHFWVGFSHGNSRQVVRYLQGILQPGQISSTSKDPELRNWFYVDDLTDLASDANSNLMAQTYNSIHLDRHRCKCLLSTGAVDVAAAVSAIVAANDAKSGDYGDYATLSVQTTTMGTSGADYATEGAEAYYEDDGYLDFETTTTAATGDTATAGTDAYEVPHVPDYACCGIGYGGTKYDTLAGECCQTGSGWKVANFDEDGASTCF